MKAGEGGRREGGECSNGGAWNRDEVDKARGGK